MRKIRLIDTRVVADGLIKNALNDLEWWVSIPPGHTGPGYTAAFYTPNRGLVVRRSNFGGSNVADHLRFLDGSTKDAVKARLERERFLMYFEHELALRTTEHVDDNSE